uniref:Uncharacterized protein n=1 Tax=Arundo donax TaxID=35708 RepID=A0A0A9GHR7_ARUDO
METSSKILNPYMPLQFLQVLQLDQQHCMFEWRNQQVSWSVWIHVPSWNHAFSLCYHLLASINLTQ